MLSFWEKRSFLNYDCIIVGSGILGLSTACSIKERKPETEILILERGVFSTGASTKNAGFACFGSLTEILYDAKTLGEDAAVSLVEKRWKGIQLLEERLGKENIDLQNYGGYELLDDKHKDAADKTEYVNGLLKDIFYDPVFEGRDKKINEFGFNVKNISSLIYSRYESQLDTGKMMKSLLKYAQSLGILIITGCEVTGYEQHEDHVNIFASHNILDEQLSFKAGTAVFAVNAFAEKLFPGSNVKPGRGQVIVTKPIEGLKFKGVFHMDEGFYYFRNFENRVLFGGGRNLDLETEATNEFKYNEKILGDLKDKLDNIILPGQSYEIDQMWTGIMGFGENKLPVIKQDRNIITALSCNGMGIALSSLVGKEIAEKF